MDVLMPQLGETVAEGKITSWFKAVGDPVKSGDNLFEIETDKVSMEVPSIIAGVIAEIRVQVGEVAKVGGIVAVISENGSAAAASKVPASAPKAEPVAPKPDLAAPKTSPPVTNGAVAAPKPAPAAVSVQKQTPLDPFNAVRTPEKNFGPAKLAKGVTVTPMARRLASEKGVDLAKLSGSGPHGRIVAQDVRSAQVSAPKPAQAAMASGPSGEQVRALYKDVPFEAQPVEGMRRIIAQRLIEAKQSVPHFYLTSDVNMDRVLALRAEVNADLQEAKSSTKLSVNDFVIKAFALALQRVPAANAVWAGDHILRFQRSDVGVAVAIDGGLLTPVIRHAESKSLSAISTEMKDLAARARDRKLQPSEYQGGSASISNLGMYGIRSFAGIINPPQSSLLAVGAAERRPVEAEDGGIRFVTQMSVTLSCDHRVVDGALGAQLLAAFRAILEQPVLMLI